MGVAGSKAVVILAMLAAGCTSVTASQSSFNRTRRHVAALNAQPTPAAGDHSVQFTGDNLAARFGCNLIGGRYSAEGETLRTFDIHSTLMGCPEPAATFERQGSLVLTAPMHIAWDGETRLTLSNTNGSIALERAS